MSQHPSRETFDALLRGGLPLAKAAKVRAHLRSRCRRCWRRLAVAVRAARRGEPPCDPASYDAPIEAAYAAATDRYEMLGRERAQADRRLPRLLGSRLPLDALLAKSSPEILTWGLCERLLAASEALRGDDPRAAVRPVELAALASDRLDPQRYGAIALADFRARLWAELGNAHRAAEDLGSAEHALRRGLELRRAGSGDPLLLARIAELFASLRTAQRHFGEAVRFLDIAYSLYLAHRDQRSAGRAAVIKGLAVGYSGDGEEAVGLLRGALSLLDRRRDGRLVFTALHNMLWFQVDLELFRDARLLLFEVRPLYAAFAGCLDNLKLRWLEGRIFAGLGDLERAERAFAQARQSFEEAGLGYYAALAALDLGGVWLRQGRTVEVRKLVDQLVATFRAVGVEREALAALLMLRDALRRDAADLDALRLAAAFLKRLERERPGHSHE